MTYFPVIPASSRYNLLGRCFRVNQSHLPHCCPFTVVTASHITLTYLLPRTDHYWKSGCSFIRSASLFLIFVLPPAHTHAKGKQRSLVFCVHSTQNKHSSPLLNLALVFYKLLLKCFLLRTVFLPELECSEGKTS